MASLKELLALGRARLAGQDAAGLEAEVLLAHVLGVNRAWLYAHGDDEAAAAARDAYRDLLERRRLGEPVAYLTGRREFWSMPLTVTPDVLIPRPETELLVQAALDVIPSDVAWRIADLGTGSGAVALAIASERPSCEVHATELSAAALAVARANGDRLLPGRVRFHRGSWLEPLKGRFQVIVSNPPYVAPGDPHLEQGDCRYEPQAALSPGDHALSAIEQIATASRTRLEHGGLLAVEHGCDQGNEVRHWLERLGYTAVRTLRDLEGRDRVSQGTWRAG